MLEDIPTERLLNMSDQEKRWLDNVKKAFFECDLILQSGRPEDCLEEMFKAVDTAKTLRRSLRGDDTKGIDHKKRFIEFLGLEIPAAREGESPIHLHETETGKIRSFTLGEIIYRIRCKIHENENLNVAEKVDYFILLDWSVQNSRFTIGTITDGKALVNGYFVWNRLREVLAKFITGIEGMISWAQRKSFSFGIRPDLASIRPERERRECN